MIKEMNGWKVLSVGRQSCRANEGCIVGCREKWSIYYPANQEVFPK